MTFAFCLLIIIAFMMIRPESHLLVSCADSGAPLFVHPMQEGDVFEILYIHSVNQSPVTEFFIIRRGQIYLTAMEFDGFGAGVPAEVGEGQELIRLPDGGMRLEGLDKWMDELVYLVSSHELHIAGDVIPLSELAGEGVPLRFGFNA